MLPEFGVYTHIFQALSHWWAGTLTVALHLVVPSSYNNTSFAAWLCSTPSGSELYGRSCPPQCLPLSPPSVMMPYRTTIPNVGIRFVFFAFQSHSSCYFVSQAQVASLSESLADAERRVYEGELVRRKLHNIIQVGQGVAEIQVGLTHA